MVWTKGTLDTRTCARGVLVEKNPESNGVYTVEGRMMPASLGLLSDFVAITKISEEPWIHDGSSWLKKKINGIDLEQSTPYEKTDEESYYTYREDSFIYAPPLKCSCSLISSGNESREDGVHRATSSVSSSRGSRTPTKELQYLTKDVKYPGTLAPIFLCATRKVNKWPGKLPGMDDIVNQEGIRWSDPCDPFIFMWDWIERDRDLVESLTI